MSTLFAGTDAGLYSVGDDARELDGRAVTALDVTASGDRWAVIGRSELWSDQGAGWERVARSDELRLNCVTSGEMVWVGASEARLLYLDDGGLVPSPAFDSAPGRDEWFTPWGGPPDVRSVAVGERYTLVNVHVGGILRKTRGEPEWQPTIDIRTDVHEVVIDPDDASRAYAATARGLATTEDGGETWELSSAGLHASYSRAIAVSEGTLFMTSSDGPYGERAALYRRGAGEPTFVKCEAGLPEWFEDNIDTGCVAASQGTIAFGAEGRVFTSSDGGASWEQVVAGIGDIHWLRFGRD